jgi:hypothetical protein
MWTLKIILFVTFMLGPPCLIGLGVLYEALRPARKRKLQHMSRADIERTLQMEELRRACRN